MFLLPGANDCTERLKGDVMTQAELLKMMAETVAEYQNCVLEVVMNEATAMAHLVPLEEWRLEMGDDYDEEDD